MNLKVVVVVILYHLFQKVSSNCISSKDLDPFLPISVETVLSPPYGISANSGVSGIWEHEASGAAPVSFGMETSLSHWPSDLCSNGLPF